MPNPTMEASTSRPRRLAVAALALAAGLGLGAGAARAEEPLRWKFQKGETIRYALVQKTATKMKAGEVERGSNVEQTSDIRWVVDEVNPEGVATMTQVIDRVRVKLDSGGQPPFEYDSAEPDKPQEGPLAATIGPMFKALAGFECTLTMDPRGRIESVKIPEKTMEALRGSLAGPMGNMFSEESMKNMITQSGLILPEAAVAKGQGWADESSLPVQQLGTIKTTKTYTVEGPDEKDPTKVRIALDAKMAVEAGENPQVSFEIKEQKNEGQFLFDAAKGRIASSHVEVKMVQLITAGPQKLQQTVDNTMEMTLAPAASAK
ncbi:DUF6263 family protein [Paludisphaera soli]|uniref:DUF6263 family protein n=1 Tax=Paludisphaera soli TaxID=2712865 RepID=UPI0013EE0DF0|nr:DUF6263 family protein [Paludisphaera soli]